ELDPVIAVVGRLGLELVHGQEVVERIAGGSARTVVVAAAAGDGERQEQDDGSHPSSMLRFRAPSRAIVSRFLLAGGGDVTRGFGLGLLACLLTTVVARPASAAPPAYVIAEYCNEFDVECTFAPIEYDKTVTLPI